MDKFREFQGPDLDDCIRQAMEWFNSPRETLEVEIIQDAKSGIFGIVGARKAKVRARKAPVAETVRTFLSGADNGKRETRQERDESAARDRLENVAAAEIQDNKSSDRQPARKAARQKETENRAVEKKNSQDARAGGPKTPRDNSRAREERQASRPETLKGAAAASAASPRPPDARACAVAGMVPDEHESEDGDNGNWPYIPASELDQDKLRSLTLEIVQKLIAPLAARETEMHFDVFQGHPRVRVDWQGDAGLLIGRDGQTLIAVQYLASRILSRFMKASLRVRLDIGDYRAKQTEHLRELAAALAEKARRTGRSYSTRPLSSYHRRLIHVCLQDARDIQTRSAGDGPLKRVVIAPRRA